MHASYKRWEYMFTMYLVMQTILKNAEKMLMQNWGRFLIVLSFVGYWLLLYAAVDYFHILIYVIWDCNSMKCHDVVEILLKKALSTINQTLTMKCHNIPTLNQIIIWYHVCMSYTRRSTCRPNESETLIKVLK